MATEMLHDKILRAAFLADVERPALLSTEDVFWKLEDPQLGLVQVKDCLEWLVQQRDMGIDRGKYSLTKTKFFELKKQFAHVGPRGISLWLAPIAPIHIPVPSPVAQPQPPIMEPVKMQPAPIPEPVVLEPAPVVEPHTLSQPAAPEPIVVPPEPIAAPAPRPTPTPASVTPAPVPGQAIPMRGLLTIQILAGLQALLVVLHCSLRLGQSNASPLTAAEVTGLLLAALLCAGQMAIARALKPGPRQALQNREAL